MVKRFILASRFWTALTIRGFGIQTTMTCLKSGLIQILDTHCTHFQSFNDSLKYFQGANKIEITVLRGNSSNPLRPSRVPQDFIYP